jgi:hypothetical protein
MKTLFPAVSFSAYGSSNPDFSFSVVALTGPIDRSSVGKDVPQGTSGAKALISRAIYGTAEGVPFVQSSFLASKAYWMDWRLVSSSHADSKALLSPSVSCGTAEAVPFVKYGERINGLKLGQILAPWPTALVNSLS